MAAKFNPVADTDFCTYVNSILAENDRIKTPSEYNWRTIKGDNPISKLKAETELPMYIYLAMEDFGICPYCLGEGKFHYQKRMEEPIELPCQICNHGQLLGLPLDDEANFKLIQSIENEPLEKG